MFHFTIVSIVWVVVAAIKPPLVLTALNVIYLNNEPSQVFVLIDSENIVYLRPIMLIWLT